MKAAQIHSLKVILFSILLNGQKSNSRSCSSNLAVCAR